MDVSADPDFADYCHQKIVASIIQAMGRLRADRRPGEKLRVYFLGDYPLPMPVKLVRAKDITMEAADSVERLKWAYEGAKIYLKGIGRKVTDLAISTLVGVSRQRIQQVRKMLILLLDTTNSKSSKNEERSPEGSDAHILGTEYFPRLALEDPVDQVDGLLNAFQAHGGRVIKQAWSFLSAAASIQLQT